MFCFFNAFQPTSPDGLSPKAPPRKKHHNKKLLLLTDFKAPKPDTGPKTAPARDSSFDYSEIASHDNPPGSPATPSSETKPDVNIIPPTPLSIRKEPDKDKQSEGKSKESPSPAQKKVLVGRTSSMPLVPIPLEVRENNTINDRKKSKSHDILSSDPEKVAPVPDSDLKLDPSHIKAIDSNLDSRHHHHHHHGHKYSIRKFKQRFKHGKKSDKNAEKNWKHSDDNESENESVSHDELASQGSRSENEENILTDDDLNHTGDDSAFVPEKKDGFFRRMSVKMKQLVLRQEDEHDSETEKKHKKKETVLTVNDLTEDNNNSKPSFNKMTLKELVHGLVHGRLNRKSSLCSMCILACLAMSVSQFHIKHVSGRNGSRIWCVSTYTFDTSVYIMM